MKGGITIRSSYKDSIVQADTSRCYICGRCGVKLDRHEPFGGGLRQKSKRLGMWVAICHEPCHMQIVHGGSGDGLVAKGLRRDAETAARAAYGWTKEQFISEFGKSYMEE